MSATNKAKLDAQIAAIRRQLEQADGSDSASIGHLIIAIDTLTDLVEALIARTTTEADYTW